MKKANYLLEKAADLYNLQLAFWKAKRGKSYGQNVLAYQAQLDTQLLMLREQILSGAVGVGHYRFFKIYDPKERQICAPAFSEQVLHHALMNVCHERFERAHIFDSYASRKGKGVHAALNRASGFTRSRKWFLKLDVKKFFDSIHHDVLKKQLWRLFREEDLLAIFDKIINSYEASPNRGLPIGNLTSQYFANHYLTGLDHFIQEHISPAGYVRYMDDMVLWSNEKNFLQRALEQIQLFVHDELLCELKPPSLNRSKCGLPFLGYLLFPHHIRLTQRSKRRFIKKWTALEEKYHSGEWSEAVCQRRALPLFAFTNHAQSLDLRKKLLFQGLIK